MAILEIKYLPIIGIALIFTGILFILISSIYSAIKGQSDVKSAGGIFIGPFPLFGWASDKKMFYILIALVILMFIIWRILNH